MLFGSLQDKKVACKAVGTLLAWVRLLLDILKDMLVVHMAVDKSVVKVSQVKSSILDFLHSPLDKRVAYMVEGTLMAYLQRLQDS